MYTKGFWIIFASYEQIGSKVVWGKCVWQCPNKHRVKCNDASLTSLPILLVFGGPYLMTSYHAHMLR